MEPSASVFARAKPRGHATGRLIPNQGRRSGQSDLRRVTLVPPNIHRADRGANSAASAPKSSKARPVTAPPWLATYRRRLIVTDVVVVVVAVSLGQHAAVLGWAPVGSGSTFGDWLISTLLVGAWLMSLGIERLWNVRILGTGPSEYRRILTASLTLAAVVGIAAYLTLAATARGYLLMTIPLGTAGLAVGHWAWRRWLRAQQRSGRLLRTLVIVGDRTAAVGLCDIVRTSPGAGYRVIAVCVLGEQPAENSVTEPIPGLLTVNKISDVAAVAVKFEAGAVAIAGSAGAAVDGIPDLSLRLEGTGVQLFVGPEVGDTASARMHLYPVAGLPLTRVGEPRFHGWQATTKRTLDLVVSAVALLLLSPFILIAAFAVLIADGLPILHDREMVGRRGHQFRAWTLRCTPLGMKARLVEIGGTLVPAAGARPVSGVSAVRVSSGSADPEGAASLISIGAPLLARPVGSVPSALPVAAGASTVTAGALIVAAAPAVAVGTAVAVGPSTATGPAVAVDARIERPGRLGSRYRSGVLEDPAGSLSMGFDLPAGWNDPIPAPPASPADDGIPSYETTPAPAYELEATNVGRVLRRLGIDESPLLLSVLLGHMSLVGPQARVAGSAPQEGTLRVRPGITGAWRVSPQVGESGQDRAREVFYYVETWSVMSDIVTIAKTVKLVLSGSEPQR